MLDVIKPVTLFCPLREYNNDNWPACQEHNHVRRRPGKVRWKQQNAFDRVEHENDNRDPNPRQIDRMAESMQNGVAPSLKIQRDPNKTPTVANNNAI